MNGMQLVLLRAVLEAIAGVAVGSFSVGSWHFRRAAEGRGPTDDVMPTFLPVDSRGLRTASFLSTGEAVFTGRGDVTRRSLLRRWVVT